MTLVPIPGGDGVPAEPDWSALYTDELDIALAQTEWGVVVREMQEAQTLSAANGHAIKRLVLYRVEYERAARSITERGVLQQAARTKVPKVNPNWAIMRQAGEEIRLLEVELGIPPVRRGRTTKVQKKAKAARAADAYLKPVAGR